MENYYKNTRRAVPGTDRNKRNAFTLIELLVVIAIIALLLSVMFPALKKAKQKATALVCSSQMKQIGAATMMYVHENNGFFPKSSHSASVSGWLRWGPALMPFLGYGSYSGSTSPAWQQVFNEFYRCPADRRVSSAWSYGKNVWFELSPSETGEIYGRGTGPTYWKYTQIRSSGMTVQFGELGEKLIMSAADHLMAHFWLMGGEPEIDTERHGKVSNYIFVDGHVETLSLEKTFSVEEKIDHWNPGRSAWPVESSRAE